MTYIVCATINAAGVTSSPPVTAQNVTSIMAGIGIACVQEAKPLRGRWSLRRLFSRRTIGVHQVTDTAAEAGSAVVWDKSRCKPGDRGITLGVKPQPGDDVLARYLVWIDLTVDRVLTLRAVAAHRPPWRERHLWPAFDRAVADLVNGSPHPVLIGTDNNSHQMPMTVRGLLVPYARGIDMFLVDELRGLRVRRVDGRPTTYHLVNTPSDHWPVALDLLVQEVPTSK